MEAGAEARAYADKQAAGVVQTIPALLDRMHVKMEASTIDGVKVHVITPNDMPAKIATVCWSMCTAAATSCSPANPGPPRPS